MTREQAINRWTDIAETVFWAEDRISKEWHPKVKEMVGKPPAESAAFVREYCRAIATEIVSKTPDEELAEIE